MKTRWKFEIKDLNNEPTILVGKPEEEMIKFVDDAVRELSRRCAIAEEQMIFKSSPTETLIRVRDFCEQEIKRRAESDTESNK